MAGECSHPVGTMLRRAEREDLVAGRAVWLYGMPLRADDEPQRHRARVAGTVAGTRANETLAFGCVDVLANDGTQHNVTLDRVAVMRR